MRKITDQATDALLAAYTTAPSRSLLVLQHVGGAIARVPITDTPYVNRDALYDCFTAWAGNATAASTNVKKAE